MSERRRLAEKKYDSIISRKTGLLNRYNIVFNDMIKSGENARLQQHRKIAFSIQNFDTASTDFGKFYYMVDYDKVGDLTIQ